MPYQPKTHRVTPILRQRDMRPSAARRGYGKRWRDLRQVFLTNNPTCQDCHGEATEAHHVSKVRDDPGRVYDWSNLIPLCKPCHTRRTARGE